MQYLQGHAISLLGRLLALIVGIVALYRACFLYEDEDGNWQNWLESIWVGIHDRAKTTDYFATALMNKISQLMTRSFDIIFGKKSFSFQMFVVSLNTSLGGFLLCDLSLVFFGHQGGYRVPFSALAGMVGIAIFFLLLAYFCIRYPKRWMFLVATLPIDFFLYYCADLAIKIVRFRSYSHMRLGGVAMQYGLMALLMLLAVASDFLAVIFLRRLLASEQYTVRLQDMVKRLLNSVAVLIVVLASPFLLLAAVEMLLRLTGINWGPNALPFAVLASVLIYLDTTTVIYCLLPVLTLVFILLNWVLWPLLSRLIYPLARYRLLRNRAGLVSIGTLGLSVAFGLEQFGIKAIMALLK